MWILNLKGKFIWKVDPLNVIVHFFVVGMCLHYDIEFAKNNSVSMIIRGLRAVSDFDYEFQMAGMNARLANHIETIFLTASENHQFVASRFVKEISLLGGDISSFVPANVNVAMKNKKI